MPTGGVPICYMDPVTREYGSPRPISMTHDGYTDAPVDNVGCDQTTLFHYWACTRCHGLEAGRVAGVGSKHCTSRRAMCARTEAGQSNDVRCAIKVLLLRAIEKLHTGWLPETVRTSSTLDKPSPKKACLNSTQLNST